MHGSWGNFWGGIPTTELLALSSMVNVCRGCCGVLRLIGVIDVGINVFLQLLLVMGVATIMSQKALSSTSLWCREAF